MILSGGLARRAGGVNKSFIPIKGRPILELQLEILRPHFGDRIGVVTDRPADFDPYMIETYGDIHLPAGRVGERSSLLGLASALVSAPAATVFLLAADMPWPDPDLILRQASHLTQRQRSAPQTAGLLLRGRMGIEPFHGFYNRSLAPSALACLNSGGSLSLQRWIAGQPEILVVDPADLGVASPQVARALANLNQLQAPAP